MSSALAGILFSLTMLMVSVALVMAVIVTNIFLRKDSGKRVPSSVRRVFLHRRRGRSSQRESVTSSAVPAVITPTTAARNHDSVPAKYRETLDLDSLSILSELEQQNNTTGVIVRQNSRRGCTSSTRRCSPSVVTNSRSRATSTQHADTLATDGSNELYSREWQMLAKIVDKIFFWLFVISSIGALGSMFASLPHKNLS